MSFFVVASIILFFMQVVIGLWFYFAFPALGWKIPAVAVPVLMTAFTRFAMAYTRTHYGTLESIAYFIAYIWAGLVFLAFCIVMIFAIAQLIASLFHRNARAILVPLSMICLAAVSLMAVYGGLTQPKIKHINITIPGAQDMTVAVISDAHLGEGVSLVKFQKALTRMKAEKPDIVFVLGDLFEYGMHKDKYAQALAEFQPPLGKFGVLGNHEYYMGYDNSVDFYKKSGITLLQNQVHTLSNGLQIIGLNDIKTARVTTETADKLFAQTDPQKPRILLSHQPSLTGTAATHEIPLMLSGHTHNGQIYPFNYLVKLQFDHVYGMYDLGPKSKIYVTSGMFYWGVPLRFLTQSEIPIIHIKGYDEK